MKYTCRIPWCSDTSDGIFSKICLFYISDENPFISEKSNATFHLSSKWALKSRQEPWDFITQFNQHTKLNEPLR